jgi:hypothetical protein
LSPPAINPCSLLLPTFFEMSLMSGGGGASCPSSPALETRGPRVA